MADLRWVPTCDGRVLRLYDGERYCGEVRRFSRVWEARTPAGPTLHDDKQAAMDAAERRVRGD